MIKPGDQFLTSHGRFLTPVINFFQKLASKDGKARFSHAGIIVDSKGTTFEAKLRIGEYNLIDYVGSEIFIFRHCCMNQKTFDKYYPEIRDESIGRIYPIYRMVFHAIPYLSKWAPFNRGVCSEKNDKLNYKCEFRPGWKGTTPDDLYDTVCDQWADQWEVVFDGVLTYDIYKNLLK